MDKLEEISFRIISGVGSAKSCYMRALQKARKGEFQESADLIKEGEEYFLTGHRAHSELLQVEGNSEQLNFSILLIHAEDQLMSTETIKIMVEEFIQVYSIIILTKWLRREMDVKSKSTKNTKTPFDRK